MSRADFGAGLPIVDANPAFAATLGRAPGEIVDQPLSALLLLDPRRDLASVRSTVESGRPEVLEARPRTRSGRTTWLELELAATPGADEVVAITRRLNRGRERQDLTGIPDAGGQDATEAEMERLLEAEQEARFAAEMAQEAMEYQATHDSLTHLLNRGELIERIEDAIGAGRPVTVLFVDLDRFKLINDSLGHATGDRMLEELARRLSWLQAERSVVARIGGDEFVIALLDADDRHAIRVADQVLHAVRNPVWIEGHSLIATSSVGISSSEQGATAEDLLRDADVALYRAKDLGGDQWAWFDEQARLDLLRRVSIERDLHEAIYSEQLELHYQPAYDLGSGEVTNVESLLRWMHPLHGTVSPGQFIPIAEESGLILPIGRWVIRHTLADASRWIHHADLAVWANVSIRQLLRPGLAQVIAHEVEAAGLDPARFGIEVTESVLADQTSVVRELGEISALGVRIAIDDFGTGYSSISRLSYLPVDVLKVDQSFIQKIERPGGVETVKAIVDLGHALDCMVIAEGVETREQLELLRGTGCDQAGGFLFCHPVPSAGVDATMHRGGEILGCCGDGSDGT